MAIFDRSKDLGAFIPASDDNMIVCRCEEISKVEIRKAIHEGMFTMTEIRRYLRTGMGLCQGNTCGRNVKNIIAAELGCHPTELDDCTSRGPARPLPVIIYGKEAFDRE